MGKVYRVHDTKLNEEIALKLIKPEIAADKRTVERFRNEIKNARKISHPNVCRTHDLGEEGKTLYLTMEYIRGEDLKSLIHRMKVLAVGAAVSVGRQIAEGLAEAHKQGIVHRDLKPGNVMIDKDGQAKIMDFGIARSLQGGGITGEGAIIGTPEYMSPEQVEGNEADQRSDIYALGIILFEMVTGRLPFEGATPFSIANKQKSEPPPDPRKLNPQIPATLDRVILRLLEKAKEKRYQTTGELLADLAAVEEALPTGERISALPKPKTSREITVKFTPRKLIMPAAAVLVLAAGSFLIWRYMLPKPVPSPHVVGMPTLVVLYFENKSGDKNLDFWRVGLPEVLIPDLSQSRYIRVVTTDELLTVLRRLGLAEAREYSSEDIGKIAAQTRATHVLRGSLIKAGESIIITIGLQKPGASDNPPPLRLEANNEKDIIVKVDELARQVKEGLNLTTAQIADDIEKDAGKITTSSPEALRYYVEGRRLHEAGNYEQSIAYMEKAVEIDPEFALAFRSMAIAHSAIGHEAEGRKYYGKALELSARLPENERLIIESDVLLADENYAKAREVLERLVKTYPGHLLGNFWLARVHWAAGDIDKAIERMEFVIQNRKTAANVWNLTLFYCENGQYQKAEDVCRSFLQDVEDNAGIRRMLSFSYLYRRRFDLALAEAERSYLLRPGSREEIDNIMLLKGAIAEAEKAYQQIFEKDRANGRACLYRIALIRGKYTEAINLMQRNLEEVKGGHNPQATIWAYRGLADALIKAGRHEEAYKVLELSLKLKAENRESAAASGLPYLPSEQQSDLFAKGKLQAEMKSFNEARRTAEELKSLIEKGINKKELRYYEYILGLIEVGKKNYRQAADLFSKACGRLDFESPWVGINYAIYFDGLARALYESGELDKAHQEYEKITLLTIGRLVDGDLYAKAFYMLGKIAEQQGDKASASQSYHKFLDLWKDADPGLPEVEDAKKRLAGLAGS